MKFILFKNRLLKALNAVSRITSKNFSLPVLEYVLIEVKDRKIRFSTTNLEIALHATVQGKVDKAGVVLVPAQILNQIIAGLDAEKIILESKDMGLEIKTDTYTGFVKGISPDDFPAIPDVSPSEQILLPSNTLRSGLSQLNNIIVISEARPEISGAYITINKDGLKMVGTDSFRLGEKQSQLQRQLKNNKEYSFILPLKAVQELIRLMEAETQDVALYIEQSQVLFDLGDIQVISRLIEGAYPDYKKVIPQEFSLEVQAPRTALIEKIKLASIFSPKTNDIKMSIDTKKNTLTLYAGSSAAGETTVSMPVKASGESIEVTFNYRFLLDGLANLDGEHAVFQFDKQFKKLMMRAKGSRDFVYVVMPIKE